MFESSLQDFVQEHIKDFCDEKEREKPRQGYVYRFECVECVCWSIFVDTEVLLYVGSIHLIRVCQSKVMIHNKLRTFV